MSRIIDKPLKVGKTDSYSLTVSTQWLGGETILSATATSDNAFITVGAVNIVDNVIYVYLTGVAAKNRVEVHFNYATATRTDCDYILVNVAEC